MGNKCKLAVAFVITVLFSVGLSISSMADIMYVNASSLNYRDQASMSGRILGKLPRGTEVECSVNQGEWSLISVEGKPVYVASRYLTKNKVNAVLKNTNSHEQQETTKKTQNHEISPYIENSWDVSLNSEMTYAEFSEINTGSAIFYQATSNNRKNKTVCINAGHGTREGSSVKTLSHPDGTPKVTGGTTAAGAVYSTAISSGMTFNDGTPESAVTLAMAKILREELLKQGYNVLMIREEEDVQLDNIARTVLANNYADCHIALHWDSTTTDKGAFYMSVPNIEAYRTMEPVASNWEKHNRLGECLVKGLENNNIKIFSSGSMAMDLTQTSYSTIPSVDIELGDKASKHTDGELKKLAKGLADGVEVFFDGK